MPISVQCPHCRKDYQVKDHLAGTTVRCTACQKPMSIPALVKAGVPAGAAPAAPRAADPPALGVPAEFARFGLEGPIRRTPDLFGPALPPQAPDLLGNHVVHDPGFGSSEYVAPKKKELNLAYQRVSEEDDSASSATKSKYISFGVLLLILGVGTFLLPLVGLEFKIIAFLPEAQQWIGGVVLSLGGIGLILGGILGKS